MTKKLQNIINILKANQSELYADGAFQFFVDNQINVDELTEILKVEGIKLPDDFYRLSKPEQKSYRRHVMVTVHYNEEGVDSIANVIFNKPYFYDLAKHARKTVIYTKKLVRYVYDLDEINLIFLGMQYIKIKNTKLRLDDKLMKYADKKGINDLYELTIDLVGGLHYLQEEIKFRNYLVKYLASDNSVGLDLNDPMTKFFFLMENLLHVLSRKEANTLKVKFLILGKEHLRGDLDYFDLDKPAKRILKDYKVKGVFGTKALKTLNDHIKANPSLLDGLYPNGHMALYYAFIAEDKE